MLIATTLQAVSSAHVGMDMREMAGFAEILMNVLLVLTTVMSMLTVRMFLGHSDAAVGMDMRVMEKYVKILRSVLSAWMTVVILLHVRIQREASSVCV
jgi:hypothetical protein